MSSSFLRKASTFVVTLRKNSVARGPLFMASSSSCSLASSSSKFLRTSGVLSYACFHSLNSLLFVAKPVLSACRASKTPCAEAGTFSPSASSSAEANARISDLLRSLTFSSVSKYSFSSVGSNRVSLNCNTCSSAFASLAVFSIWVSIPLNRRVRGPPPFPRLSSSFSSSLMRSSTSPTT